MLFKNSLSFLSRLIKNAPLTLLLVMALNPAAQAAVEHINYKENKMNYLITADQFILAWNKVKSIGYDFEIASTTEQGVGVCNADADCKLDGAEFYKIYDVPGKGKHIAYYDASGKLVGVGRYISEADVSTFIHCTEVVCGEALVVNGTAAYYTFYKLDSGGYLLAIYGANGNLVSSEVVTSAPLSITPLDQPSYIKNLDAPPTIPAWVGSRIKGKASVSPSGTANYAVPIKVPAGYVVGMAPTLSINYNSNAGVATLGRGWSLGGVSMVYRCASTMHQEGRVVGVGNGGDRFCIGGQRLYKLLTMQTTLP